MLCLRAQAGVAFYALLLRKIMSCMPRQPLSSGAVQDSFIRLLEEKGASLAQPDVLISAVGTIVYQR